MIKYLLLVKNDECRKRKTMLPSMRKEISLKKVREGGEEGPVKDAFFGKDGLIRPLSNNL